MPVSTYCFDEPVCSICEFNWEMCFASKWTAFPGCYLIWFLRLSRLGKYITSVGQLNIKWVFVSSIKAINCIVKAMYWSLSAKKNIRKNSHHSFLEPSLETIVLFCFFNTTRGTKRHNRDQNRGLSASCTSWLILGCWFCCLWWKVWIWTIQTVE